MAKDEAALFKAVMASAAMGKSRNLRKLMQFLYDNVGALTTSKDIWLYVLGEKGACEGQRVRELASRLRKVLEEIEWVTDSQNFYALPDADEPDEDGDTGYRLVLRPRPKKLATEAFWRPHTKADLVRLIYAEPVFYYDIVDGLYLRFVDTNPGTGMRESLMTELETNHKTQLEKLYAQEALARLKPTRDFVGTGEVGALDALSKWFLQRALLRTKKGASHQVAGLAGGCPILLGSMRTNKFIENVLSSEEGRTLCYSLDAQQIGFITIRGANENERQSLRGFTVTEIPGGITAGLLPTLSQVRSRLALVQRMPLPGGKGTVTIISSDTSLAIKEIAATLTDDDQMEALLTRTGWPNAALPEVFEMLFSVRIAPANIEHEAGVPELLAFR